MSRFDRIDDILLNSDKAELIEKIGNILDTEGSKIVIITGIPNSKTNGLDIEVWQTGHSYRYEEWGFIQEAATIVDNYDGAPDMK